MLLLLALLACRADDPRPPKVPVDTAAPAGPPALVFDGAPPRNLLFLSIDTLRKDHVGPWSDLGLTPFLDGLTAEGVVLDDHVQCGNWTYASVTCTLAGRTNIERGHLPRLNGTPRQRTPVPADTMLLAGWLRDAGLHTVMASSNAWFSFLWGNTQGYIDQIDFGGAGQAGWDQAAAALATAQAAGADRWFLHMHMVEPHAAYAPPSGYVQGRDTLEPWPHGDLRVRDDHYDQRDAYGDLSPAERDLLEAHLRRLYEGEVRYTDALLQGFFDDAEARGWLDDTLVVIWNDHGEQFWEHGDQTHAFSLHGEENDGFAIFWAKNLRPGRWAGPTHAIDLVPTVLHALDVPIPDEVTGRVVGTAADDRYRFTASLARRGGVQAVQQGDLRLHYDWRGGTLSLYDRSTDPGETQDLYHPGHPDALELWTVLRPMAEAMAALVVDGPEPTWPYGTN